MERLALFAVVALVMLPVQASEYFVRQALPVFIQAQGARAVVYMARVGQTASLLKADSVYVAEQPVGLLPANSYTVTTVEPGFYFVWWRVFARYDGDWFEFKPGQTYLLRSPSRHGYWYLDDPARIRGLIAEAKLTYITLTDAGQAKLQKVRTRKYAKLRQLRLRSYEKALTWQAQSVGAALPIQVNLTDYQRELGRHREPRFRGLFGVMDVNADRVLWESKKERIEIPASEIREISFAGLSTREQAVWIRVRYGPRAAPRDAFFHSAVDAGFLWSHNRKFAALADAMLNRRVQ